MTKVSTGGPKLRKNMLLRMLNKKVLFSIYVCNHCCRDKKVFLREQQQKLITMVFYLLTNSLYVLISIEGTILPSLFNAASKNGKHHYS